jgi:energy-coupling factor transporter ATP-binding protein EcfA2
MAEASDWNKAGPPLVEKIMLGAAKRAFLISGHPGCGKTTLVRRLVDELRVPAGGFYTEEIRTRGHREERRGHLRSVVQHDGDPLVAADPHRVVRGHGLVDQLAQARVGEAGRARCGQRGGAVRAAVEKRAEGVLLCHVGALNGMR